MKKIIIALLVSGVLAGCATTQGIKLTTQTVPQAVPILYCPAPPALTRPTLPIQHLSDADMNNDGLLAKAFAESVEALIGYSEQLEDITGQYKNVSDSYATLKAKIAADWKAKTGEDLVIPDQDKTITVPAGKTSK